MEKENSELQPNFLDLRKQAEEKLRQKNTELSTFSDEKKDKLINELQVHQIELEMQNDELRKTQLELHKIKDEYSDLYNFAPVGYLVLNKKGLIVNANLTSVTMLGYEKKGLRNLGFSNFIDKESQDIFYFHRNKIVENQTPQTCELQLVRKDKTKFWAQLECAGKYDDTGKLIQFNANLIDVSKRKQAEEQIKASLIEKETLLNEIHHRVKNNMTVISSLLGLQMSNTDNQIAKDALQDSKNRVQSMSMIHETLYRSDNLSSIDLKKYLSELGKTIFQNYSISNKVHFKVEADNIMISVKQASPVGLIVNELIANCLKYAFSDNREGEILVGFKSNKENGVELMVSDNGVGIPEGFDLQKVDSLGLKLVKMLVENQLDGSIDMESNNRTKFTIKFNIET
jgi:PAS domain S-box-containing protein